MGCNEVAIDIDIEIEIVKGKRRESASPQNRCRVYEVLSSLSVSEFRITSCQLVTPTLPLS